MRKVQAKVVETIDDLALGDFRALQTADYIYFQSGADPQILQFGRRETTRIQIDDINHIKPEHRDGRSLVLVCNIDFC